MAFDLSDSDRFMSFRKDSAYKILPEVAITLEFPICASRSTSRDLFQVPVGTINKHVAVRSYVHGPLALMAIIPAASSVLVELPEKPPILVCSLTP